MPARADLAEDALLGFAVLDARIRWHLDQADAEAQQELRALTEASDEAELAGSLAAAAGFAVLAFHPEADEAVGFIDQVVSAIPAGPVEAQGLGSDLAGSADAIRAAVRGERAASGGATMVDLAAAVIASVGEPRADLRGKLASFRRLALKDIAAASAG